MALLSEILAASTVRGERGPTASIDAGTVTVLNPNQTPTITNSGTTGSAVIDFGIPRAQDIGVGTLTTVTPASSMAVSMTTHTNGDKSLNLSMPRQRNITLGSVTTLSAGSSASATSSTNGDGDVTINFSIPAGAAGNIGSVGNHVLPTATNTWDLGSPTVRFRNIYVNDLEMSNGIGDYTIVEGEEDLFLYNNKNGKVYKFLIQEVDPTTAPSKSKSD